MRSLSIETVESLNQAFRENPGWANGKNFPVDHLHATVAESRWEYENIHGIYLTNEPHAWMALWMAVTNRNILRKRHIGYMRPTEADDSLGRIKLFTQTPAVDNLCQSAYVYIFNPSTFQDRETVDVSAVPKEDKVPLLLENGFERQEVERRGKLYDGLVDITGKSRVIHVDEWQIALTNSPDIIPDTELAVRQNAIKQLAGRIAVSHIEIGEDYIQ